VVLAIVVVCFLAIGLITRSPLGLTFQGLRDSETRMVALGYRPELYRFYAFILSGFFATLAGILYVYQHEFISPAAAEFMTSGHGVLMMILGGVGTLTGPLVGSFVIVFIENVVSAHVGRWPTVMGLMFIFTVLFARRGIVGAITALWSRTRWGVSGPHTGSDADPAETRSLPTRGSGGSAQHESSKEGIRS
jgi:branched-chain amino acid transport system permease protein